MTPKLTTGIFNPVLPSVLYIISLPRDGVAARTVRSRTVKPAAPARPDLRKFLRFICLRIDGLFKVPDPYFGFDFVNKRLQKSYNESALINIGFTSLYSSNHQANIQIFYICLVVLSGSIKNRIQYEPLHSQPDFKRGRE